MGLEDSFHTLESSSGRFQQPYLQEFLSRAEKAWWDSDLDLPDFQRSYTLREQIANERQLDRLVNSLISELERISRTGADPRILQDRFTPVGLAYAKTVFGLEDRHLQMVQRHHLPDTAAEFVSLARRFDPAVSPDDIYQASRNAVAMNLLQLLLGLPVKMTLPIFVFSMLYPYTDNYLDDPAVAVKTKLEFNSRFRLRIQGEEVRSANQNEQKIYTLIEMIEHQYARDEFPQLYQSLLDIHTAQTRSLRQHRRGASPYEVDILGTIFEKGGTSILADGYLVAGSLTCMQAEFCYGLGTYTQLIDDLEDVHSDLCDGTLTLFTQTAGHWPLDALTNRVFHYGNQVLKGMDAFNSVDLPLLKELFTAYFPPLLIDTAGRAGRYYTRPYLKKLETYLPFRFACTQHQRKKLLRHKTSLARLLETVDLTEHVQWSDLLSRPI